MVGRRHEAKAAILITIADAKWAKQTNCAQNGAAALSDSICLHIKTECCFRPMETRDLLMSSEPRYLMYSKRMDAERPPTSKCSRPRTGATYFKT
jgi:hypothetical protein